MPEIFGAALMGGGGKTDAFAAIGVTYPEGAICTCSYGTKTLTAKDTSGRALFLVPTAGQWLVKATSQTQEAEDTVSITTQGQVASVTLAFFEATIAVTFPTDCTSVTCTKGDTVFSVPSGELSKGSYTFSVHETGEWTLECTNGVDTDTETVNVTEEKVYSVALSFLLYFYNAGDECTDVTGGWKGSGDGKVSNTGSELKIHSNAMEIYFYTTNLINITGLKTLIFDAEWKNGSAPPSNRVHFGLSKKQSGANPSIKVNLSGAQRKEYSLDVSNVNDTYYIQGSVSREEGGSGDFIIHRVWGVPK